ncbi:MAG: hypothetical protein OXU31_02540, partial [Gammaproteobacteria bacterium]|nr:hypothetical protein [Gammaproteobacteria bacterium]
WRLMFPTAVAGPDATRVVPASAADFAMVSRDGGTATITAGSSSVDITIATAADLIQEPVESFSVELVSGTETGGGPIVGSGLSVSTTMGSAAATIEASDDGGSSGVMSVDMTSTAMAPQSVDEGNAAAFSVQLVRGASTPPDIAASSTNMPTSSVAVDVSYTVSITMQQGGSAADNPMDNLDISGVTDCAGAEVSYTDAADGATIATGCVRIPAGSSSQSFTIGAVFDNLDEGTTAEELVIQLTSVAVPMNSGLQAPEVSSTAADTTRSANINNVNTARTLAIAATTASADEGGDLVFTVTVDGEPVSEAFMVAWTVSAGAADISGETSGMVNFGISSMRTQTQTITLRAADDAESEAAETVTVMLTDPCTSGSVCDVGGRAGLTSAQTPAMQLVTPEANGAIRESDRPVTVQLTAPPTTNLGTAVEGDAADFTVSFAESVTTTAAVEVDWTITFPAVSDSVNPASAADFAATTGTFSIPAGMNTATLSITSTDDAVNEAIERYIVTLSSPRGGGAIAAPVLHATSSGTASISSSDPVRVRLARRAGQSGAVREGNTAEFTVSLSLAVDGSPGAVSGGAICVPFQVDVVSQAPVNTAGTGADIEGVSDCDGNPVTVRLTTLANQVDVASLAEGGVLIPAGQSSADFSIGARFDGVEETANEDMVVEITDPTPRAGAEAATLARESLRTVTVPIENVNSLRTLEVSAATLTGDEDSASMPGGAEAFVSYTVGITGENLAEEVSVTWSLAGADGANLPGATASGQSGLGRNHGGDHEADFGRARIAEAGGGTVNADGISGTLIFPVGAPTTRTVQVPVVQDARNEGAERLTLTVADPCPATGVCMVGGGGGGSTPALQLGAGERAATLPASDPAMLRITRVGSGTVVSGEGITYQVSLGNTFLNGRSVPVVASAPLMVMVPLRVGGADSGQSFTVEVPLGQSSGQATVSDTVLSMALSGQSGRPMLSLGMASVTGAPGPSGSEAMVMAPDPSDPADSANLPAPVQTAAWELTRTGGGAEAPEGGSYEVTFTLRGSDTPAGGLSFDWSIAGSAATDGGAPAVAADFARTAGYACGAAAVGATCTALPSGTVRFTAGNTSQTIAIAVRDDSADNQGEGRGPGGTIRAEGFTLRFTALSGTDVGRVEYAAGSQLPGELQVDIPALRADLSVA